MIEEVKKPTQPLTDEELWGEEYPPVRRYTVDICDGCRLLVGVREFPKEKPCQEK